MQTVNKRIRVVAALIRKEDQVFATQRGYGAYKDWWEFPGGKVETGETPEEALVREIREELGAGIAVDRYLTTVEYDYPEFHLSMDCFWCHIEEGELVLLEHEAAKWLPLCHLRQVDWLPADVLVVEKIEEALSREDAGKTEKTVTESGADRGGIDRKNSEPGSGLRLQPLTPQYDLRLAELSAYLREHYHPEAAGGESGSSVPAGSGGGPSAAAPDGLLRKEDLTPHQAADLSELLGELGPSFHERLFSLIDGRGMTDAEVYRRAGLDRKLFSKIRTNPAYHPRKNTVMAICLALRLEIGEAEDLLARAGYAFSPGSKGDLIVKFFIEHRVYDTEAVNFMLEEYGESALS